VRTTFEPPCFDVWMTPGPDAQIAVRGELDLAATPAFQTALQKLEIRSLRSLVLDLAELTFMDAAGLHAVLDLHEVCLSGATSLTIVPGPWNVQRVFELAGCDGLLRPPSAC
jgi:anti-anti-sigma factor